MSEEDRDSSKTSQALTRRGFMRRAGASTGAMAVSGVVAATAADAAPTPPQRKTRTKGVDYDVIVLGCGFAGITAARDSSKNGYRTLVLEARDRLGGRTFTSQFAGHKVELGGTWIHWTQPFVWGEVQRYGLEVEETPTGQLDEQVATLVALVDGRREVLDKPEQLGPVFKAFGQFFEKAGELWERPFDASFRWKEIAAYDKVNGYDTLQKMALSRVQKVALEAYVAGLTHSPPRDSAFVEVSRWWSLPGGNMAALHDSCGRYTFKHGTVSLLHKMIEDGRPEIRLSSPVKSVDDRGSHVVVTTAKGERLTAAAVIVGVPMNVLPNIQFSPPLPPQVVEAGREKHAGAGIKLLIKVKGRLAAGRVNAVAPATHPLPLIVTYAVAEDHTVLVMFGPNPKAIDYRDKAQVQKALRDYFPDAVVEEVHHNPWTEDPYAQGTWCNYKPGWFSKYYEHFQKDRGRVFFGQGDHGEGWRGFIDGAIGAGGSAALRVKARLG